MPTNFYVSIEYGRRHLIALGPLATHYEAQQWVSVVRAEAQRRYQGDPHLPWYGYGTCSTEGQPPTLFNYLLEAGLPRHRAAQLPNRRIRLGDERRLAWDPCRPVSRDNPIVARTWRVIGRPVAHGDCVYVEPVGCDGFKINQPRMLNLRYWEGEAE